MGAPAAPAPTFRQSGPRAWLRRLWEPPDQFLLDAGKAGELLIAKVRLAFTSVLLLIPLANLWLALPEERDQHVTGLFITLFACAMSGLVFALVARDRRQRWLPMATSVLDVSLISFALMIYAFIGDPHQVVNSKVTFDTYFIALGAVCLRYDRRVAVVAGALTFLQYLAIVVIVATTFDLDTVGGRSPYGRFQVADQVSRLILLATATAITVYIVTAMQRQRKLSTADPLTGVFNRRFFDDYFATELQRAERYSSALAVAMIDVDHFKRFNDVHGHATGDRALRNVARVLRDAIRRSDLVARYGGEEFVVLFRETDAKQALDRVEEIRRAIEAEPLVTGRATGPARVTVSAGVASWPKDGKTPEELLGCADRRLFEAKNGGRNRVVGPRSH